MNNWYNRINGIQPTVQTPSSQPIQFQNQMQYIVNAMQNPVAFVSEQFPDVPVNIRNNPGAILNYLSQTRGNAFMNQLKQLRNR